MLRNWTKDENSTREFCWKDNFTEDSIKIKWKIKFNPWNLPKDNLTEESELKENWISSTKLKR